MSKYKNIKCEFRGIKFDSIKERNYYLILLDYQKRGLIKDLKRQVSYELIPTYKINGKTIRKTTYKADFTYISVKDNKLHVVDIKSPITAKEKAYRIKKKLFEYKYGIEIEEVF